MTAPIFPQGTALLRPDRRRPISLTTRKPGSWCEALEARICPASLFATLEGGKLTISDFDEVGVHNDLTVVRSGGNLVITDAVEQFSEPPAGGILSNNARMLTIPLASITTTLEFNTRGGSDTVTFDFSGGNMIPAGGVDFNGGNGEIDSDALVIAGGSQGLVTYNYTNPNDGNVVMSAYGTIRYTGLEPITNTGLADDIIFNLPADVANTVFFGDDGIVGNGLTTLSGGTFETTSFTNPLGGVTIHRGDAADQIILTDANDFVAGLTIGTNAAPFASVFFNGVMNLEEDSSLAAFGVGTMLVNAGGAISAGRDLLLHSETNVEIRGQILKTLGADATLTIQAFNHIFLGIGSQVISLANELNVVLNSNCDATLGGAIALEPGAQIYSNGGDITFGGGLDPSITKAEGNLAPVLQKAALLNGIRIDGGMINSGTGTIILNGLGAMNADKVSAGLRMGGGTIQTTTGDIIIRTQGGSGTSSHGVLLEGGQITTVDGTIDITAAAGSTYFEGNAGGISIQTTGVAIAASGTGNVIITGIGGIGAGDLDVGVQLITNAAIQVASGTMTITGTATYGNSPGVRLSDSSSGRLLSSGGAITIVGTGFGTAPGFVAGGNSVIGGPTDTGVISIQADRVQLGVSVIEAVNLQTTGTVKLLPLTNGRTISLGLADSATTLGLTDAELDRITASRVEIGDASSGAITISEVISPANYPTLALQTTASFAETGGFASDISSATNYEKIEAAGAVSIAPGATLTVTAVGGFVPAGADIFRLINNVSDNGTTGTFTGKGEGASVPVGGVARTISYVRGTGNDVELFLAGVDLTLTKTDNVTQPIVPGAPNGGALTYVLSYANAGEAAATNVVLTETVPLGTHVVAGENPGWTQVGNTNVYTHTIASLAAKATGSVNFVVHVDATVAADLQAISNTATIGDDGEHGADLNLADNTATDSDAISADAELTIQISDDVDLAVRGGLVVYTITYENVGNRDFRDAFIAQTLPENGSFWFTSSPGWFFAGNQVYANSLGTVAAGDGPHTLTFVIQVNRTLPAGFTTLETEAAIGDANGLDLNGGNDDRNDRLAARLALAADFDNPEATDSESTLIYQGIYVISPGISLPGRGAMPALRVFDIATGVETSINAYEPTYRKSIRVATGDINGDGYDDIITSTITGNGRIRVFDGRTGERLSIGEQMELAAFPERGAKGAFVASADVNGDGRDDIIVGSGYRAGGTPKLRVFSGLGGEMLLDTVPFAAKFRGGVRVAAGDVNGDGLADIITSQGVGGNDVRITSGVSTTVLSSFEVGGPRYRGGVFVAAAEDLNDDGRADLVLGRDRGATIIETFSITEGSATKLSSFIPFAANYRLGVRVAVADINLDGVADIIAASGGLNQSKVKIFDGVTHAEMTEKALTAFSAFPIGALFAAGSSPAPSIGRPSQGG
jgi:fibronectin-binding autotransporter adhesin